MATKAHVAIDSVTGGVQFGLTLPNGVMISARYKAEASMLVGYDGRPLVQLGPKGRAKVEAAMAEVRPAVWEEAIGAEATGDGWEFVGVRNDVLGVYRRCVSEAVTRDIEL